MKPKKDIEKTANRLLDRLLQISVILNMFSLPEKTSLFSRENLRHLQESLWQTAQEYRMGKEKGETMLKNWEKEKNKQIYELNESYKNESERIRIEYSPLNKMPGIKRISRIKHDERQEQLKEERNEMQNVIEEDYGIRKEQVEKSIQKHECLVQKYIKESENVLYEFDQIYTLLHQTKQESAEKNYPFIQTTKRKA